MKVKARHIWINPGSEKNKDWNGFYIDLIVVDDPKDKSAWIIEIETEAENQWKKYDEEYTSWCLAVLKETKEKASALLQKQGITSCKVITWKLESDGSHAFWDSRD